MPRRALRLGLSGRGSGVTIHDLSVSGMLIETGATLRPFDGLDVDLPEAGLTESIVIWNSGRFYGCEFKERISQAAVSAALLQSEPQIPQAARLPRRSAAATALAPPTKQTEADYVHDEERARLGVRLRVILGSAILLWALLIWGTLSLYHLIVRYSG